MEAIELCRQAAYDSVGIPTCMAIHVPFRVGDYEQLWRRDPKQVRRLLDETLCAPRVQDGLRLLLRFNVLYALFPEVTSMRALYDGDGLHKDVWEHTLIVVAGVPAEVDVRWGALLHDIGKSRTRRVIGKRVTFHNHDIVGARMVDQMQLRTGLFNDDDALFQTVRHLVREHLRPAGYKPNEWTDSAVRRLLTECGDERFFEKLMSLSRSDLTTKNPLKRQKAERRANDLEQRVKVVMSEMNAPKLPKGTMGDILVASGRKPGNWLANLRDCLEVDMASGTLAIDLTREDYVNIGLKQLQSEKHS